MLAIRQLSSFILFSSENQLVENLKVAIDNMRSIAYPVGFVRSTNRGLSRAIGILSRKAAMGARKCNTDRTIVEKICNHMSSFAIEKYMAS